MKTAIRTAIADAEALILACWEAGEMPNLIGPPGIGKTDVAGDAARAYSREVFERLLGEGKMAGAANTPGFAENFVPFFPRSFATQTAEDFTVPDRDPSGAVIHKPVGAYRVACDRAAVVLCDEVNRCGHGTQNAALTLFQNRVLGDYKLHEDSRLISAMNDADEEGGDGAHERLSALADRQVDIVVEATFEGWFNYATQRIGAQGSSLRALAIDYAFCADRSRRLVSLTPQAGEEKRPSPRAIRKGLGVYDAALRRGLSPAQARVLMGGCISDEVAGAFLAIQKLRADLPDAATIETDPLNALLPKNSDIAWAAAGLLGMVALKKADPAWLYLGRFGGELAEVQMATGRMLIRGAPKPTLPAALAIHGRILGLEGLARAGQPIPGLSW